jgi:hypothetical protein
LIRKRTKKRGWDRGVYEGRGGKKDGIENFKKEVKEKGWD